MYQLKSKESNPTDLRELCKFLNKVHRIVWTALAIILAGCAMIWNPAHLATAALLLLFSRARWEESDLKALK